MIYLLLVMLFVVGMSFYLNDFDVISPSVLFSTSILLGVFFATLYQNKWSLDLGTNTFFVISGGTIIFLITAFLIKFLFLNRNLCGKVKKSSELKFYFIKNWKVYSFIIFEIFIILCTIYFVVILTNGNFNNITASIVKYRDANLFSNDKIFLPRLVTYSRVAINAAGYWFSYIFISNWIFTKKIDFRFLIIIILSMLSNFILGGRNGMINILIGLITSYFIIINYQTGFSKNLNWKLLVKLLLIFIALLISFESLALLIGRSGIVGTSGLDYLAVYIGAPVKNLDTFLKELPSPRGWEQSQTFNYVVNWIGNKLNRSDLIYVLHLPFQSVNNQALGNVYTTFYPYIYDFGYIGLPILVFIMSSISQILYEFVKRGNPLNEVPLIRNLVYSYVSSSLLLSFFSNKFYEQQFNISFIQILIVFYLFNFFFCKNTLEDILLKIKNKT